jgi:hypothetical protein
MISTTLTMILYQYTFLFGWLQFTQISGQQSLNTENDTRLIQLNQFILIFHSSTIAFWFRMKPSNKERMVNAHRYILWRRAIEHDNGPCNIDAIIISIGEHGSLHTQAANVQSENQKKIKSENLLDELTAHNIAEIRRATEEADKWETRVDDSPLGKTQQDFAAYYTGVLALFKEWCTANSVPFPD